MSLVVFVFGMIRKINTDGHRLCSCYIGTESLYVTGKWLRWFPEIDQLNFRYCALHSHPCSIFLFDAKPLQLSVQYRGVPEYADTS
jgi:hypothetical protein